MRVSVLKGTHVAKNVRLLLPAPNYGAFYQKPFLVFLSHRKSAEHGVPSCMALGITILLTNTSQHLQTITESSFLMFRVILIDRLGFACHVSLLIRLCVEIEDLVSIVTAALRKSPQLAGVSHDLSLPARVSQNFPTHPEEARVGQKVWEIM